MKKSIIAIIIIVAVIGLLFLVFKKDDRSSIAQISNSSTLENQGANTTVSEDNLTSKAKISAEKIEVVHFHATQQCWSCITVGEYALKTIKEKFPEEYAKGIIVFKDINGELAENKDIVMQYQARGSSLFVNAITNGKDKIEEDITVWRLVSNEKQFISYFENKLKTLLGK